MKDKQAVDVHSWEEFLFKEFQVLYMVTIQATLENYLTGRLSRQNIITVYMPTYSCN